MVPPPAQPVVPPPAQPQGQPPQPPPALSHGPEGTRERAAAAFQEALDAFQSSDFATARQRYEEAYKLAPHPNTLYNLALACERLLDYDAAIDAFQRFLDEPLLGDAEAARLQQTRRLLAERALRRLVSLPARISISAVPDPVTASLSWLPGSSSPSTQGNGSSKAGDAQRCKTPCIITVPAGSYRLTMQRDGYYSEQVELEAHVGQALLISRQLRPRPRRVQIESQPRANLYLDDRPLGQTPFLGEISLGTHHVRLERRFYLTHSGTLDVPERPASPSSPLLRVPVRLELSGRTDMIIGGALAGAGLGLMVMRLVLGTEIDMLGPGDYPGPLVAATLTALLGASIAGFAGWEMPVSQAQLLIGSGAWGTLVGFGIGLGAGPTQFLPDVLAVGGAVIGGTLGAAVYRFVQPSSGAVAIFNSVALWSSVIGALGWSQLIADDPSTAFYSRNQGGQSNSPPNSMGTVQRSGTGGWIMFGTALGGVAIGIGLSHLPVARELSRGQVALVDLGGAIGGLVGGALGMGFGYLSSLENGMSTPQTWNRTAHIAVPCTIGGIGVGLISAALLVNSYRQHQAANPSPSHKPALPIHSGPPQLNLGRDVGGGTSIGLGIMDGTF